MGFVTVGKKEKVVNKVLSIEINAIQTNPSQPRTEFAEEQLKLLAQSIQENGLLQPLTVRKHYKGYYELISGERRLRACRMLGYTHVPCIVVTRTERESAVLALIENIHREDLSIFEQANALKKLIMEWNITQEEVAAKLGMAQSTVANNIRLLKLSEEEQQLILENQLTERHARAALKLEQEDQRKEAILLAGKKKWNVAQMEQYVKSVLEGNAKKETVRKIPILRDVRLFVNTINKAIQAMKDAGIPASSERKDEEGYITYTVRIPTK